MRVTADTNTIVSGMLWHGPPRRMLNAARDGLIELFTTRELLYELEDVLGREKFSGRITAANSSIRDLVVNFSSLATLVVPSKIDPAITRDPDDDEVIACAVASDSELIVSGDNDLLDLRMYKDIRILRASDFLSELGL